MAEPTRLTPQLIQALGDKLRKGNYIGPACRAVGLNPATYYAWMRHGQKEHMRLQDPDAVPNPDKLQYLSFYYEMEQAKAEAETLLVEVWQSQAKETWRAARDMLSRRYPERWGKSERIKVNLPDDDIDSAIERELARLAPGSEIGAPPEAAAEGERAALADRVH